MIIRVPDNLSDYYNFPLCLKKEAKVEKVSIINMNTKLDSNTNDKNSNKNKDNSGFDEILETELKKYR